MTIVSANLVAGRDNTGDNINRDLEQVISNIDRQDTPFYSSIGSRKIKNITHEWLTDDYEDAQFRAYRENYQYSAGDVTQEVRRVLNNNPQIFIEPYGVSDTAVAVDTAGVANEFSYQAMKKGVKIRRDVERQMLSLPAGNNAGTAVPNTLKTSTETTPAANPNLTGGRRMSSVFSFADWHHVQGSSGTANTSVSRVGANGTRVAAGTITDNILRIEAEGTQQILDGGANAAITRDRINELLAAMYGGGARPSMIMMSPSRKVAVSAALFADGTAGSGIIQRLDSMEKKLNMAVTGVQTDFGFDLALVPNWLYNDASGTGNADPATMLFYDPSMIKTGVLRPLSSKRDLAQSGDGMRGLLRCEKTLIVQNPTSVGVMHSVSA